MTKTTGGINLLKRVESVMKEERWRDAVALLKKHDSVTQTHWQLLWNLGWCYFKLQRMDQAYKHLRKAAQLAQGPRENWVSLYGLGQVLLKKERYRKAERVLFEALQIRATHHVRISLALAYLAQGKIDEAESLHLENIRMKPKQSERYDSYAAFLYDVGRTNEAEQMIRKAKDLRQIH